MVVGNSIIRSSPWSPSAPAFQFLAPPSIAAPVTSKLMSSLPLIAQVSSSSLAPAVPSAPILTTLLKKGLPAWSWVAAMPPRI